MFTNPRKTLRIINWILYFVSICLLVSGLVLSTAAKPVEADSGSVKTRSSCGVTAVDTNHYAVGDHVFIYYTGLGEGTHTWEIRYTNKAGKPLVEVASDPSIQGTGTVTGDTGCFDAWVIQPEEANYRFSATVDNKQDGYVVDLATSTPTMTATNTRTPTATATNTFTPTATSTSTATHTFTPTATLTSTSTNTPTLTSTSTNTPTLTSTYTPIPTMTATDTNAPTATETHTPTPLATTPPATATPVSTETPTDLPTATATEETIVPTSIPPDPTATEIVTLDPTEQPTDALTLTPQVTATAVPTLSMPSSANANVISPMTGADFSRTASSNGAAGRLQMSGLAVLGAAIVMTGYRRKNNL